MNDDQIVQMTAQITKRFLATQKVDADKLPDLITGVFNSLWAAQNPTPQAEPEVRARNYTRRSKGQSVSESPAEAEATEDDGPAS